MSFELYFSQLLNLLGARKQLNQFWFKTFMCIMKNRSDLKLMKRGFIINQKLLVDYQVATLRLSSDVNDERCFSPSFFVFHSFSILWFSARAKLMSPVSSPAHHTRFIPHFHDYLTFLRYIACLKNLSSRFQSTFLTLS